MSFDVGERIREFRKQAGLIHTRSVNGSNPFGATNESLETSTFQGFFIAFSAVPIVPYRAFCAVCGMQNGMQ